MHRHKIIALIGAGVIAVVAGAWMLQFEGSTHVLYERFPNVPKDVVRKVHKEMTREAFAGEYSNFIDDDSALDALFLAKVQQYV